MKGPISATALVIVALSREGGRTATMRRHARRGISPGPRPQREREQSSALATGWRASGCVGLAGAGAEGAGDVTPGVEERCRRRQVEDDPAHRADDMDPEREQPL